MVLGAEGRSRVLTHSESLPFDGAIVVGLGANFVGSRTVAGVTINGTSTALITGGLSLGRRIDPKNSQVSIVPYGEPVLVIMSGGGNTDIGVALGLGADFRLSRLFDARVSVGLGGINQSMEGVAFSAVWVH